MPPQKTLRVLGNKKKSLSALIFDFIMQNEEYHPLPPLRMHLFPKMRVLEETNMSQKSEIAKNISGGRFTNKKIQTTNIGDLDYISLIFKISKIILVGFEHFVNHILYFIHRKNCTG